MTQALTAYQKTVGHNHPKIATCLNNLAGLYEMEGQFAQAESLYQQSLTILETALGQDHPDAALVRNNLRAIQSHFQP